MLTIGIPHANARPASDGRPGSSGLASPSLRLCDLPGLHSLGDKMRALNQIISKAHSASTLIFQNTHAIASLTNHDCLSMI